MKINLRKNQNSFILLKNDKILTHTLNLDIKYFLENLTFDNELVLKKNLKDKIFFAWENADLKNKEILQLLYHVDFALIWDLQNKYGFDFVEFSSPQQIKEIMPTLALLEEESPLLLSFNNTIGLSFIQDGLNTAYYKNGFSQKYLDELKKDKKDFSLEQEININISELITNAYAVEQSQIDFLDKDILLSVINQALDVSNKNLIGLKLQPKLISKKQISEDLLINKDVEQKVLIDVKFSGKK